jgi:hypothetical protein
MVQKGLGLEKSSTPLDLYTRKTSNHDRILKRSTAKTRAPTRCRDGWCRDVC